MKNNDSINKALDLLRLLVLKQDDYDNINKQIRTIQGNDFPTTIRSIDLALEDYVVNLLDSVLGDNIASYWIYECQHMKNGGSITENNIEWKITNIDSVEAFVRRHCAKN